jgi:hypothetical protein
MNPSGLTAKHRAAASQPTPKVTSARSRSAANRTRDRRRSLILSLGILLVIGSAVLVAAMIDRPASPGATPAAAVRPDRDLRTAKVMNDTGNGCTQQILDNQTWHTSGAAQPCDPVLRDANGVPVPVGTIHRLDAINKSFMGK